MWHKRKHKKISPTFVRSNKIECSLVAVWGLYLGLIHRRWILQNLHTHTANEGPEKIQYKCLVPIYVFLETKLLFPKRIIMFCLPVPILIYLWEIYILPGSVWIFCCRKICGTVVVIYVKRSQTHEWRNFKWGRAIPINGIFIAVHRNCQSVILDFYQQAHWSQEFYSSNNVHYISL